MMEKTTAAMEKNLQDTHRLTEMAVLLAQMIGAHQVSLPLGGVPDRARAPK
jgi:hypothetical protein